MELNIDCNVQLSNEYTFVFYLEVTYGYAAQKFR
jgi:hypothetical protein